MKKHRDQPDQVYESAVQLMDEEWKQTGLDEASLEQSRLLVDRLDTLAASGRSVEDILAEWQGLSAAEIRGTQKESTPSGERKAIPPDLLPFHESAHLLHYLVISDLLQSVLKELTALNEELRHRHERALLLAQVQTAIHDLQHGLALLPRDPVRSLEDLSNVRSMLGNINETYDASPSTQRAFQAASLGYELLEYNLST